MSQKWESSLFSVFDEAVWNNYLLCGTQKLNSSFFVFLYNESQLATIWQFMGENVFQYLVLCCTEVIYTLKIKDLYWHLIVCENKNRVCMCLNVYCVKFKGMDYPKNKNAIIYYRWCNAYYVEQKLKVTLCCFGFSLQWKSMGSNVIWLPVDNLWKKCASNIIFCVAQKKAIMHTLITCIYASTKNIYIHGIFPFHKMLEKILLRTVHQTILWAPKNGSSVPLLWKKTFGPLVLFLKRCKSKWCQNVEWTFPVREHYTMKSLCVSVWMRKL